MAEDRVTTSRRLRIFERAVWMKSSRYMLSGLIIIVLGIVLTILGVVLTAGIYNSPLALLIGFGALVFIVGVIRLLIGFINPTGPADLLHLEEEPVSSEKRIEEE